MKVSWWREGRSTEFSLSAYFFILQVLGGMLYKIYYIDSLVENFFVNFNRHYADAMATDFNKLSLQEQVAYVKLLYRVRNQLFGVQRSDLNGMLYNIQ